MNYEELLPDFLRNMDPGIYMSDNFVVLDLETTTYGGSPSPLNEDNDIVCGSWCVGPDGPASNIYGGVFDQYELVQACYEADYVVAYNGKFDLQWLARAGMDMGRVLLADPMIAEYVLTGNMKAGQKGMLKLDTLMQEYFGEGKTPFIDICMRKGVNPVDMPKSLLIKRATSDVVMTRRLWLTQRDVLNEYKLLGLLYTRCLLSPVLAEIETRGVYLDADAVIAEHQHTSKVMHEMSTELNMMLDGRNPRSVPQMREFIYEVLKFKPPKKGKVDQFPTGKEVLAFKPTNKKQTRFLALKKEFAQVNADLTKNLDYFYGVVKEKNGLFYAQFNQTVTVTHRLSSSGIGTKFEMFPKKKSIQLQNSPRKYKRLYTARTPDWYVVEVDGAQIEFRVAGYLGQDVRICQDIIDGVDVHTFTAHILNNCTQEEVSGGMRTAAKADTFKPLYGGQFGTDEQMAYYKAFREKYPGIAATQRRWEGECLQRKQFTIPTGLTFYFPACKLSGSGYNADFPSICNYPVQNLATAEIIPIGLVALWHVMRALKLRAFMNNTVHDSVIIESPKDELEELYKISKWAFLWWVYDYLDTVYGIEFNVPLGLGFAAGTSWSSGKQLHFEPIKGKGEALKVKDGEIVVTAVPPVRMAGVDYSAIED